MELNFESEEYTKEFVLEECGFAITLREFLMLYNFRNYISDRETEEGRQDCLLVRIYLTDYNSDSSKWRHWFELGINDFDVCNFDVIDYAFNPNLLNKIVDSVRVDDEIGILCIHLV